MKEKTARQNSKKSAYKIYISNVKLFIPQKSNTVASSKSVYDTVNDLLSINESMILLTICFR